MEFVHASPHVPLDSAIGQAAQSAARSFVGANFSSENPVGFRFKLLDGSELFITAQVRKPRREMPGFPSAAVPPVKS